MSSSDAPVIRLDLTRQKLLIKPDDPLPRFHPPPKAIMVTPIYDYDGDLASPSGSRSPSESRGSGPKYAYAYSGSGGSRHHGHGSFYSHHTNSLRRSRHGSTAYSPSYINYPELPDDDDDYPYSPEFVDENERDFDPRYRNSYRRFSTISRSNTNTSGWGSRIRKIFSFSRSNSRLRSRPRLTRLASSLDSPDRPPSDTSSYPTTRTPSPHDRAVYTDSEISDTEPPPRHHKLRRRASSYSPNRRHRYESRSPSPDRRERSRYSDERYPEDDYDRGHHRYREHDNRGSSSYRDSYSHRYSSYPHSQSRVTDRSRPNDDPLVQNMPDYQAQATGHASSHAPSHVPSHAPSHHSTVHGGGGGVIPIAASTHSTGSHRPPPIDPDAHSHDYAYDRPPTSHHGGGGRPPTSASIHAGRSPFIPPGSVAPSIYSAHTAHTGHTGRPSHHGGGSAYAGSSRPMSSHGMQMMKPLASVVGSAALSVSSGSSTSGRGGEYGGRGRAQDYDDLVDKMMRRYLQVVPVHPQWCRSKCTGRKKAVCIGINYVGQKNELRGCYNDARDMREFLIRQYHFPPDQILLLTDADSASPLPTRKEMFNAFMWLVKDAQKDDSLFFHYSGHGGQSRDASGREADKMDEVIFPVDFDQAGDIIDDELYQSLVKPLPAGCRLTTIFDSCHSGTVLDLPYLHSAHGRLRSIDHISVRARERGMAPSADVICFAACKDDETSADTFQGGVAVGAMSNCFLQSLEGNTHQTYEELLTNLRHTLIPKYHQKAQISGTHPLDLDRQFTL